MPTYTQLYVEAAFNAEYQPPSLVRLCEQLRAHFGVSASALGSKGDNNHVYGYHRSRRWVLQSRYSAYGSGDYSVVSALDRGGDENWLAAIDITVPAEQLLPMCQRLDAAVRAGRLPQVREWYGNLDGDRIVDGYDALAGRVATSDDSHLWHCHISLYRSRAGDDHSNLLAVLTSTEEDPMASFPTDNPYTVHNIDRLLSAFITDSDTVTGLKAPDGRVLDPYPNPLNLDRIATAVAAKVAVGAVDLKALAAEIKKVVPEPLTAAQTAQAAFEGAQRAEKE